MKIAQFNPVTNKTNNKAFQKKFWDQIWSQRSFEELVNQLDVNPTFWKLKKRISKGQKILEAGCGFGQWVYRLSAEGYNILGVDNAPQTIAKIKRECPSLTIKLADVEKLPFKDGTFDTYLSFGVVEHFPEGPEGVLAEAHRVLKSGGLLYLTVPYLNFFRFVKSLLNKNNNGQFYQYLYSPREITERIENCGFKVETVQGYDFITALNKDFPFIFKLIQKVRKKSRNKNKVKKSKISYLLNEPDFRLQRLLYKLDSYIILIEAHKK